MTLLSLSPLHPPVFPLYLPCDPGRCAPGDPKPGRYPTAAEGVVDMTACFVRPESMITCDHYVTVGVVSCEGFLLWRLPYAPSCGSGYCTANASGL